ncbi:putative efflux pump antibiotic resistance protein [Cercophora newfieldiana]|uniref:Efflux pump antibiotic resistance protein n=1 Tax=Cercophora newfieldiana TaxID=92897 RepID=A0AA39XZM4_9PEZI|nr:putative efflux pump antibiotic resistance protein [Cercophora newfieldiana]
MAPPSRTSTSDDESRLPSQKEGEPKPNFSDSENPAAKPGSVTEPDEYPHGLALFVVVAAIILTVFLTSLDQTIVGTAIPKITNEFGGLEKVSWFGSAYFMCLGGFQSTYGKIYKYFPLKQTFLVSVFIFEIGSLICAVAPNPDAFIVGRAIAGVGGAGCASGGAVILAFSVPPEKRPSLMGLVGFAYTIAAIIGPILGGAFADRVTWRWCFYINLPIGGVSMLLIMLFFKNPSASKPAEATWTEKLKHMDPVGSALAMGSIISFILALQYAGVTHAWNSSTVIGLLVGFVAILAALFAWEFYIGEYAMLPPRLMKKRYLWGSSLFQFFFAGCYFLLLYYLPIYFQSIKGEDAVQSGVDNLPLVISGCLSIITGGIVVTKTRHATPFMALGAALTTVGCGLLYTLDIDTSTGKWIGYQILLGFAIAFPFQNALNIAQANSTNEDMSMATAFLTFFQILGGAFSISAAQSGFVNRLISSLAVHAPAVHPLQVIGTGAADLRAVFPPEVLPGIVLAYMDGLRAAFAVAIGFAGVSFLFVSVVPWKRLHSKPEGDAMVMA